MLKVKNAGKIWLLAKIMGFDWSTARSADKKMGQQKADSCSATQKKRETCRKNHN